VANSHVLLSPILASGSIEAKPNLWQQIYWLKVAIKKGETRKFK